MARLRIAACQLNPVVGDLDGNVEAIVAALARAEEAGCDLAVFGELAITGYPPEDLLLKPGFVADNVAALARVASATRQCAALVGFVELSLDLHNAAGMCVEGSVVGVTRKVLLPNYSVFDEQRYFAPGGPPAFLYKVAGIRVGVSICEDAWSPTGPIADQAVGGAELLVNLSASPFAAGRLSDRDATLATRAADASCPLVYVNHVGGQDELVFDGGSLVLDSAGQVLASAGQFGEEVMIVDLDVPPSFRKRLLDPRGRRPSVALPTVTVSEHHREGGTFPPVPSPAPRPVASAPGEVHQALVLGTRDYVRKNGFSDVVIGLSGGVDSSLVAAIATDALGPAHVHGVAMPSRYSSEGSLADAKALAHNLGIELRTVPIEAAHSAFLGMLAPELGGAPAGGTEENLQSRIRGVVLMALSNATGWMVLTTGNKSELATGYSTLYGDTAGGFAVIKDVPKTLVYDLCRYLNAKRGREVIPEAVISKAPSAELRPDQRDEDSLPPYEVLDPLLAAYVEWDRSAAELVADGFDPALVERVTTLVDRAEYKRRQGPPGVRVSAKAFGKDRRVPITNRYGSRP
ncbi:MAG: NAD+ synthase [Acidimicrobiales bacterium]